MKELDGSFPHNIVAVPPERDGVIPRNLKVVMRLAEVYVQSPNS